MTPLLTGVLVGAGIGTGALLAIAGARRIPRPPRARLRLFGGERRWWAVALVAGLLVGVVTGWPVAGLLAAVGVLGAPWIARATGDLRTRVDRIEAIAAWTAQLRDVLAAAAGLEQALRATTTTAPEAIRAEVTTLAGTLSAGGPLVPALRQLADELADSTADVVIAVLVLAASRQARTLAPLLGELAAEASVQARLRIRIDTARARTRTSVRVIASTTILFATGMVVFNRDFLAPYDTTTGQLVLSLVGAVFAGAMAWLMRLSRVEEPPRLLITQPGGRSS
ncbi:type II secretion system F family protein [Allokutzneria albata]|uniref:Flp pilus assembly protein TadB n=1 Tax=Allokutzneria albata TaxID=211114 RepID=A0A1G9Y9X5_ALLAB|nr:pilus assembly protein TadB [Allokutzneria albata]SDN05924.1 Flp pilus assembly protein TadB [Allokutzneria albata]